VVIHHFNRLIRNKWVWGVFAVAISFFFAFDFLLDGSSAGAGEGASVGKLGEKDVPASLFRDVVNSFLRMERGAEARPRNEVNRSAWEQIAALEVARAAGLEASDDDVRRAIQSDPSFRGPSGAFDRRAYAYVLAENGFTEAMYEDQLRRQLALAALSRAAVGGASWVAPAEIDRALADFTDTFTVRVATFKDEQSFDVKVSDEQLKAYYADNTNSIALPDCMTVRYVVFEADDPAEMAKYSFSDDELHDHYDAVSSRYETQTTNGVVTKAFEEVKGELLAELQRIAALDALRTNLLFRCYPPEGAAASKTSKLDEIAKETKRTVRTSLPFSPEGVRFVPGLMTTADRIAPGVEGFAAAAAELDPETEELRYGVVTGTNLVYLIERASFAKAHVPSFEEAKAAIAAPARVHVRNENFKAAVEKQRTAAVAAVAAGKPFDAKAFASATVSSSVVFSVSQLMRGTVEDTDLRDAFREVMKLEKGGISPFVASSVPSKGLLVFVEDRKPGDQADAAFLRTQIREQRGSLAARETVAGWTKWNLDRTGFTPTSGEASVLPDDAEISED